jgi:VanZ family protein
MINVLNLKSGSKWFALLTVILWAGAIFSFSAIPNLHSGLSRDLLLRKIAHVTEYFILACLLYRTLTVSCGWKKSRIFLIVSLLCLLYASSDEAHQLLVEGRNAAVFDVMVDFAGVLCFLGIFGSARLRKTILGGVLCFVLLCPSTASSRETCPGTVTLSPVNSLRAKPRAHFDISIPETAPAKPSAF